jgi:hypothetical protein
MAWSERTTVIANPARRLRRKVKNVARQSKRLSLKQKLHFGSKAQRAAAKRSLKAKRHSKRTNVARRRKRTNVARRRKRTNPVARHRVRTRPRAIKRRRRKNPGEIISVALAPMGNPAKRRKKKAMATTRRRRKVNASRRRSNAGRPRRRRSNPGGHRHRRRNPGGAGLGNVITQAIGVGSGAVLSKLLTQMVLGAQNVSYMGYFGNAAATALLTFAAHMFSPLRKFAPSIAVGGATQVLLRIVGDMTPYGQYLQGTGLGDYQAANFWMPPRMVNAPNSAMYAQNWLPAGAPAAVSTSTSPASAPGGLGSYDAPMW